MSKPQFPIGPLHIPATISREDLDKAIQVLKVFPAQLKLLTQTLTDAQLEMPYRDGSWTIRQLIHHIADAHHHSYNRLRWTLSENTPLIKAYDQDAYAVLEDYTTMPIAWSLTHIEVLHQKLTYILERLKKEDWKKAYIHPETNSEVSLAAMAITYAWHSMHHLAHIKNGLA
jgi:hypothetical protein